MQKVNRQLFLEEAAKTLEGILDMLESRPSLSLKELTGNGRDADKTVLVVVDLVNGFTREGPLKSPRVEALISGIGALSEACDGWRIPKLAFADCHTAQSPEFESYPPHCLSGTAESQLVDELKMAGGFTVIPKNSTNGFLEEAFQAWLSEHPQTENFIIAGDCTDICVYQLATTIKAYFNKSDRKSRIIVPMDCVDTYDLGLHNGNLANAMALFFMAGNGVMLYERIAG